MGHLRRVGPSGRAARPSAGGLARPRLRYPQPRPSRAANPVTPAAAPLCSSQLSGGGATVGAAGADLGREGAARGVKDSRGWPMPGSRTLRTGQVRTTPGSGLAYAALGSQVAVVGAGLTVSAYQATTGERLWTTVLTGFPAGSAITAVRVWPGVVTVGVVPPTVPVPAPGRTP